MEEIDPNFRVRVEAMVAQIPRGRVMTYGQLAALCGQPRAARVVGGIAHFGDPKLPWQRVVNKQGGLASGYPGGWAGHKAALEYEGVEVSDDFKVNAGKLLWNPIEPDQTRSNLPPLVVIVGETATGKSALAIALAQEFDGEIIAADSRTVYRGMDIGTAKPTAEERAGVPHYGLDVVDPDKTFTAHAFQRLAYRAIDDIAGRGKLPIMVGGTGLYIDAVLYDFRFRPVADLAERAALQRLPVFELQQRIRSAGLPMPNNVQNPRHLIRTLEAGEAPQQARCLRPNTLVLGLAVLRDVLQERVAQRVDMMLAAGLIEESARLYNQYGDIESLRTPGYSALTAYLRGEIDLETAKQRFIRTDLQLAKRQRTWFKRSHDIHWLDPDNKLTQARERIRDFLAR